MMFSFPISLFTFRSAVTKAPIHKHFIGSTSTGTTTLTRNNSNMTDPKRVLSYEDMLKVINEPQKVIIDVREPDEVASTGKIPSSINIPLSSVPDTLQSMSQEDFKKQYQRDKPTSDDEIIFYCRSGKRANEALNKALKLGYKNSKNYVGSWTEWSSKRK